MLEQSAPEIEWIDIVQGQSITLNLPVYDWDGEIVDATGNFAGYELHAAFRMSEGVGKPLLYELNDSAPPDPDGIILADGSAGYSVQVVIAGISTAGILAESLKQGDTAHLIGEISLGNQIAGVVYTRKLDIRFRQSIEPLPEFPEP